MRRHHSNPHPLPPSHMPLLVGQAAALDHQGLLVQLAAPLPERVTRAYRRFFGDLWRMGTWWKKWTMMTIEGGNMMMNHSFMMNNDGKQWAMVTIDDEQ